MKKVILAEGDSWTAGDIINPDLEVKLHGFVNHPSNDEYRLPKVWPAKLDEYFHARIINNAVAGSSNDGIVRRTIDKVLKLLKTISSDRILVIVGFSSPERKDFYYKKDSTSAWDTVYPLDIEADHLSPDRKIFYKEYGKIYWNKEEYLTRYIQSVILLHGFLESKNIEHIFFDAFYEMKEFGLKHSYSLNSEINRLNSTLGEFKIKSLDLYNSIEEYKRIHKKVYINTSFKSFIKHNNYEIEGYHPNEESHQAWAKYIRDHYYSKHIFSVKDNVNSATLHAPTEEQLALYKDIPEINEIDNRGYPMCRPLFSTSDMHYTLNIREKKAEDLAPDENFIYPTILHHDNVLAFKHLNLIPDYVLDAVQSHRCKLIFDNSLEGNNVRQVIPALYNSVKKLELPAQQIYYITNNLYAEHQHKEYIKQHYVTNRINVISFMYNVSDIKRLIYSPGIVEGGRLPEKVDVQKLIKFKSNNLNNIKHFLKVNRTGRPERNIFMLFINKHNLYKEFKISFPEYGPENCYDLFPELSSEDNIKELTEKIPFDIDSTDTDNHGNPGIGKGKFDADLPFQIKHYDETFISLVMCAFPFDDACHLHSSTFNPIYCGHPIIQFGPKGSLAELRKRGFKTFGRWWNEDYDTIEEGWDRLKAIFNLVLELSKKSPTEMLEMYKDMEETLQYNSDLIYSYNVHNELTNRIISNAI